MDDLSGVDGPCVVVETGHMRIQNREGICINNEVMLF